ncbi:MAG: glycosyltransferase [Terracidiphilus sp.]|jgi:glycosyltransferase involved in cell wall biosynthesis
MLRIAVVTRYFPSSAEPWQGRSAYQTLRVLARQADVRVFYPNARYPSWLKPRSRSYNALDPSYSPPDVKASYYDYSALPLVSRPFNGWMAARVLLPHVRGFAPDLIFSCFLYPEGYVALKIGKILSVPVVAMSIGSDINRIGDPISALHTRKVLREADFVVTVSGDLRKKAVAMGVPPEKARAIINGCDISVFHVGDRREARQRLGIAPAAEAVVYIGRMDVKKGLRELVEAAASLHPQRPELHVYLVGEGPDRPIIENAIHANSAVNYIHALHECAFDDVAVWMAAADLVTLPSYMEGCPNVVLEALACGRPVVATNVGGIPEIMNDEDGCLVPPRDPAALAHALASVLDRTWDAAAVSARSSRSWSDVAAELLAIFESLTAKRQAAAITR